MHGINNALADSCRSDVKRNPLKVKKDLNLKADIFTRNSCHGTPMARNKIVVAAMYNPDDACIFSTD